MRRVVQSGPVRDFSPAELVADRAVHVTGLVLGIAAASMLTLIAAINAPWLALVAVVVYSLGLVAMLSFSAAYNLARRSRHRPLLRRLDHAAIFVMIAGTYTPFTILGLQGGWRIGMTIAVWSLAAIGIAVKLFGATTRSTKVSAALYLVFGWMGIIAIEPLLRSVDPIALILVAIGGGLYSFGVVFHATEQMHYQNAIWHAFVLAAAIVHFAAVAEIVTAAA